MMYNKHLPDIQCDIYVPNVFYIYIYIYVCVCVYSFPSYR